MQPTHQPDPPLVRQHGSSSSDKKAVRSGQRVPSGPRPSRQLPPVNRTGQTSGSRAVIHPDEHAPHVPASQSQWTTSPEQSPAVTSSAKLTSPEEPGSSSSTAHVVRPEFSTTQGTSISYTAVQIEASIAPSITSPRSRPTGLRLDTMNLRPPEPQSPKKASSPSLKHWQQIRSHVVTTPLAEQVPTQTHGKEKRRSKLVARTVGRLGLKQAAENVMGLEDRRRSLAAYMDGVDGLSTEEKEEIARERRRFSRDVRVCLDACAQEETRRRLARANNHGRDKSGPTTDFSAYAPLLTELHKFLPSARARRVWSRTCPHHGAILAELGMAFLPNSTSTDGEQQQVLEVFGAVVRNWAPEGPEDELSRWLWLCEALRVGDRQLRTRGLPLLLAFLHHDPNIPSSPARPSTAEAFRSLAISLIQLLHAIETSKYNASDHIQTVKSMLTDLAEGQIIAVTDEGISARGSERDLLWASLGHCLSVDHTAQWLLRPENPLLISFAPHPILHATPPSILLLRANASIVFLTSTTSSISYLDDTSVARAWQAVSDLVLPQLELLPREDETLLAQLRLYVAVVIRQHSTQASDDPFSGPTAIDQVYADAHARLMSAWSSQSTRVSSSNAFTEAIQCCHVTAAIRVLSSMLRDKASLQLAVQGVEAFFNKIDNDDIPQMRSFLNMLAHSHPAIFYKPLFSLAAATKPDVVVPRLQLVRRLASAIGTATFWLESDPSMMGVLLCGQASKSVAALGLGRCAVMAEFTLAIASVGHVEKGSDLRIFLDAVEARLGSGYSDIHGLEVASQSMLCHAFHAIRCATRSTRRSAWMSGILHLYLASDTGQSSSPLLDVYSRLATSEPELAQHTPHIDDSQLSDLLRMSAYESSRRLVVLLQACWTEDEWNSILPGVWRRLGTSETFHLSDLFCIAKCAQVVPGTLDKIVKAELTHSSSVIRVQAMQKIAAMYGYRHQIQSVQTLNDRRGPALQFPGESYNFAPTEIGSANWTTPQEMQDAALNKFGKTLPLDVRQRLLELNWSDDPTLSIGDERDKMPVSALPVARLVEGSAPVKGVAGSAVPRRRMSTSSNGSGGGRSKGAVFPPSFIYLVGEGQNDGIALATRDDLTRLLQRDDGALMVRLFSDHVEDYPLALGRLNALVAGCTPGFAHAAFNAIVGHLKHHLRLHLTFEHHASAIASAARLLPLLSGTSLRDVRKSKVEAVLLPASIHEDEAGFKLHAPWQRNDLPVQTAQLVFLLAYLKASPRDVYLIKRMMFNLSVHDALSDVNFARSWLSLVLHVFQVVHRTYNERSELRHFISLSASAMEKQMDDLPTVTGAIRFFMLCSARYRRLFSAVGVQSCMPQIFGAYVQGTAAVRDCIEHAFRSMYHIHSETVVYNACVAIVRATDPKQVDAAALYDLLASLASPNSARTGIASGIKGLNDREEKEALVAMMSGPEIALSDIGKDRAERQAAKFAAVSSESSLFPVENINRLVFTIIASNPASRVGVGFITVLRGMIPSIRSAGLTSQKLMDDGVEALGSLVSRRDSDAAGGGDEETDWEACKLAYLNLTQDHVIAKGVISATALRTVIDIALGLLHSSSPRASVESREAISSLLGELARQQISAGTIRAFLDDIEPFYRSCISIVDFSGVLMALAELLHERKYTVDDALVRVVQERYLLRAVRYVSDISSTGQRGETPASSVSLLISEAVFASGDALGGVEAAIPSARFVSDLILPLVMGLSERPGKQAILDGAWVRILRVLFRTIDHAVDPQAAYALDARVAAVVVAVQAMKIVIVRGEKAISGVKGLWTLIGDRLDRLFGDSHDPSIHTAAGLRTPLALTLRPSVMLACHIAEKGHSIVSDHRAHDIEATNIQDSIVRVRASSTRTIPRVSLASPETTPISTPNPQASTHSPSSRPRGRLSESRKVSMQSTPILGYARRPSSLHPRPGTAGSTPSASPRASPVPQRETPELSNVGRLAAPGVRYRFPSSATVRNVKTAIGPDALRSSERPGKGGAIVHLLGAPSAVLSAPGAAGMTRRASIDGRGQSAILEDVRSYRLTTEGMRNAALLARRRVLMVYGGSGNDGQEMGASRMSSTEMINEIVTQTYCMVNEEFREICGIGNDSVREHEGWMDKQEPDTPDLSDEENGNDPFDVGFEKIKE